MFSSPVARRNLLSAFMTSEPAAAGAEEPPDDAKSARAIAAQLLGLTLAWACAAALAEDAAAGACRPPAPTHDSGAQDIARADPYAEDSTRTDADAVARAHEPGAHHAQLRRHLLALARRARGDAAHHSPRAGRQRCPSGWPPSMARAASSSAPARVSPATCPTSARCWWSSARRRSRWSGFPAVNDQTASFYDIREVGRTRLNRRDTHVITVSPKDEYRYGYRLWIDDSTAMPLKTQLCDAHGHVIEQVVFASLTLLCAHPRLAPSGRRSRPRASSGCATMRRRRRRRPPPRLAWNALRLPPGFRMTVRSAQVLPGSINRWTTWCSPTAWPRCRCSSRRSPAPAAQAPRAQSAAVGSSSAFSTVVDGHKITAVGEVPPATVQFIATQVKAQDLVPARRPHR